MYLCCVRSIQPPFKVFFPQVLALCLIIGVWLPGSNAAANLLASKVILNDYLVEGKDLTIKYSIYNVGTRYLLHVELKHLHMFDIDLEFDCRLRTLHLRPLTAMY